MKTEFILFGVILIVVLIDFLFKTTKNNSSKEIEKFKEKQIIG